MEGIFDTDRTFLPRLGFEFTTQRKDFRYFGYGPHESYVDMHHGSRMGMYQSTAEKEYVPYIMPQEHGNHYATKYLEMGDVYFISAQGFECCVSEYSTQELESKNHSFELEKDGLTHVRLDYKVSGIGSNSCGPQLLEKYRLQDEKVKFAFSIVKL
jgi:beta-galactosidase